MLPTEEKKRFGDMLAAARNKREEAQLSLDRGRLDLGRSALAQRQKDARIEIPIAALGAGVKGYTGYQEGQQAKREADMLRKMAQKYGVT
jgi:hypothetical protein